MRGKIMTFLRKLEQEYDIRILMAVNLETVASAIHLQRATGMLGLYTCSGQSGTSAL